MSDPHDILHSQQWRARRKRGSTKGSRKSYVKGKVIDGEHELYALSIAVMLGVRTSIGTTNASINPKEKKWLSSDDFMATEKYIFRPAVSVLNILVCALPLFVIHIAESVLLCLLLLFLKPSRFIFGNNNQKPTTTIDRELPTHLPINWAIPSSSRITPPSPLLTYGGCLV